MGYTFKATGMALIKGTSTWEPYMVEGAAPTYAEARKAATKPLRTRVTRDSFVAIKLAGA